MNTADVIFTVRGLGKKFGGLLAMKDVDMTMHSGEIRALIGPNGAGKTTFLNLVTGVYRPSEGEIYFKGRSLVGARPSAITAAGVVRTFQHPALFGGLDVQENVALGAMSRHPWRLFGDLLGTKHSSRAAVSTRESALQWLAFVGLEHKRDHAVSSLTPAERRLVEVARAMATGPRLLLLDEPFAGMTQTEAESLFQLIRTIRDSGVSVLLIDHNMSVVMKLADQVTVLSFGRKIGEGTPAEVRSSEAVISAYLGQENVAVQS